MPARLALLTLLVATVAACDSSAPDRRSPAIEVVRAVRDTTLRVQRDTLRLNLRTLFRHPDGLALRFGYTAGPNVGASMLADGATLQVVPLSDGRSNVSVEAITPDGARGTAGFNVNSTTTWCPEPARGYVDYAKLRDGQTLSFSYTASQGFGLVRSFDGVVEWTLSDRSGCLNGVRTFTATQAFRGTYTYVSRGGTAIPPSNRVLRDTTWTTQVSLTFTDRELRYKGGTIAPFHLSTAPEEVTSTVRFNVGAACKPTYNITLSKTSGLKHLYSDTGCNGTVDSESLARRL